MKTRIQGPRFVLALGLAVALAVGAEPALSATGPGHQQARHLAVATNVVGTTFTSICGFSHRNFDDLIVSPRRPGVAHNHTYVGNRSTNANSTLATLRRAGTTCQRTTDTAAYWAPTLFDGRGNAIEPIKASIYYRRATIRTVVAFPAGLRMIAGNSMATRPQGRNITSWSCGFAGSRTSSAAIPRCPPGRRTSLALHVIFPGCWNGRDLDSADHKRHMAYPVKGVCPASHPVAVPTIGLTLRYPVRGAADLELASGGQYSAHADFFNSWNQRAFRRLVNRCLNTLAHCGRGG